VALKTFETERLVVRPLAVDDLDKLYQLIYADLKVRQYFTSLTTYEQVEQSHLTQVRKNTAILIMAPKWGVAHRKRAFLPAWWAGQPFIWSEVG